MSEGARDRTVFVCGTPLQVLGCVSLVRSGGEGLGEVDLVLRHDFAGSHELAGRMAASGLFAQVLGAERAGDPTFSLRGNETDELPVDPAALLASQLGEQAAAALDGSCGRIVCSYPYDTVKALWSLSPRAELVAIDDGFGSYVGNIFADNGGALLPAPRRLYLWAPGLYRGELCDDVRPIPLDSSRDGLAFLLALFGVEERDLEPYRRARCVYLTQPIDDKPERAREAQVVLDVLASFGGSVFVRRHPRDAMAPDPRFDYDENNAPWELICLSGALGESVALVSSLSTAQLMPRVLRGEEPPVVFTRGLAGTPESQTEREIVDIARLAYERADRIFEPSTPDELRRQLSGILA